MLCVLERERPNTTGHPREVANHKAIFGICVDPLSPHTLATHAEVSSICFGGVHQGDVFPYMVVQCYFVYVCVFVYRVGVFIYGTSASSQDL